MCGWRVTKERGARSYSAKSTAGDLRVTVGCADVWMCGSREGSPLTVWNIVQCSCITIFFGQTKVDDVDKVERFAGAHNKIGRLNERMNSSGQTRFARSYNNRVGRINKREKCAYGIDLGKQHH